MTWRSGCVAVALVASGCGGEVDVGSTPAPQSAGPVDAPLVALLDGERVVGLVADGARLAWVRRLSDGSARVEQKRGTAAVETLGTIQKLPDELAATIPSLVAFAADGVVWIDPTAKLAHTTRDVPLADEPVGVARDASGGVYVLARSSVVRVGDDGPVELAKLEESASPCRISVDEGFVWFGERAAWRVMRVPVSGGPVELYADRRRLACGVVVDAERATWIDVDPTLRVFVTRFSKRTFPPPDYIPAASTEVGYYTPGGFLVDLAVHGTHAFTANAEDGKIVDVDLDRTERQPVTDGREGLSSIAATDDAVLYADRRGIWRIAR